jgi:hypothetical protein
MPKDKLVNNAKAIHDVLMANMPDDAVHDAKTCVVCSVEPEGGKVPDGKTYTAEEMQAALDVATTPLLQELARFQSAESTAAIDDAVGAVRAELEVRIDELQAELDLTVLGKQAAIDEFANFKADKEAKEKEDEDAKGWDAKKAARTKDAIEIASFPEDYVAANADRWTALTDEVWEERKAEWAAIAPISGSADRLGASIPKTTALGSLTAARETGQTRTNTTTKHRALMHDVMSGMQQGFDPRSI